MRRFERIISLMAVLGVLWHAGLFVRHNGIMLDAAFDRLAFAFAGGLICSSSRDAAPSGPGLPERSGELSHCLVCVGAAADAAILPSQVALPGKFAQAALCIPY